MVTTVGTETSLPDLLTNLIHLDYDAIEAYRTAVERLDDAALAETLRGFMADHERHTRDVSAALTRLGHTPPTGGDMKQLLTTGKVAMADMFGDKAILQAMKTNEDDTNTAYERAVGHAEVTPDIRGLLDSNLGDERRHRAWIEETLNRL